MLTRLEFDDAFDNEMYDDEYMEYIQENADPNVRPIYNGDSLLAAFEDQYLFEEFREFILTRGY